MGKGGGGRGRRLSPEEDAKRYREGYPDLVDAVDAWDNLKFHKGEIKSRSMDSKWPEDFIDTIHQDWKGKYDLLERHHSWVQWLFPIREQGVNRDSQPLTCAERDAIMEDKQCTQRMLASYKLALDFYGLVLADEDTGELQRSSHWKPRFANLNTKTHNFLRLTRILKWLGEFGLARYQAPLVRALASGVFEAPNSLWDMRKSLLDYFVPVVKDDCERESLQATLRDMDSEAQAAWSGAGGSRGSSGIRTRDASFGADGPSRQKQRWQPSQGWERGAWSAGAWSSGGRW
eukprot:TRINITY_DN49905_c0_g1_i1.p1 TRINITY_DN49905_c0_g1~~TRINITY_DN49905_c0_g1_i1.p1  ORF type:complete len:289 (+),score=29.06 TRINITY_DN49905_c0_g1_i1:35-901(+)